MEFIESFHWARMSALDKAVSTEDLCADTTKESAISGIARLEAILQTLVETKVEALKNDSRKTSSAHSSPKSLLSRLRLTSSSSQSTKGDESEKDKGLSNNSIRENDSYVVDMKILSKSVRKQDMSVLSPVHCKVQSYELSSNSEEERNRSSNHSDHIYFDGRCPSLLQERLKCYCARDSKGQIIKVQDDYVSLKVDNFPDIVDVTIPFSRRKMQRRRKRRMKKRMAAHQRHLVGTVGLSDRYKDLSEDELSRRAKWTIIATACLLLFMCLLLVGITLRMAPIIDEIVRGESLKMCTGVDKSSDISIFLQIPENDRFSSRCSSVSINKPCDQPSRLRRTVSLEDILDVRRKEKHFTRGHKTRRTTQLTSKESSRRRRRYDSKSSSLLVQYVQETSRRSSKHGSRRSSVRSSRKPSTTTFIQEEPEDALKYRKRKIIVFVVTGCFSVLTLISVLSVVVTLTSR